MDTTQKPRQETKNRPPQDTGAQKRARTPGQRQSAQRPAREAREPREKPAETRESSSQRQRPVEGRRPAPAEAGRVKRPAENREKPRRPAEGTAKERRPSEQNDRRKRPADKAAAPRKQEKRPARKEAGKRRPEAEDISNKKRAYGNSKPKKKTAVLALMESIEQSAKKNAEKKKKGKGNRSKQPTPAVIYTQPAAFNRNRLIVQLITVTAVVLALVIGLSVFFKVEHVYVSGAKVYSENSITEVCGISEGDNLLTFSHARAAALIQANRPYVREVRFGIKLPDTVNLIVGNK